MLKRDIENMTRYYGQFAPELNQTHYAEELWSIYEAGDLSADTELTGEFEIDESAADVDGVLDEIASILSEEEERKGWENAEDLDD
jgi:RIO kinase 1